MTEDWATAPACEVESEWVYRRYGERPATRLNWPTLEEMRKTLTRQDRARNAGSALDPIG